MKKLETILLAIDLDENQTRTLEACARLAAAFDSTVLPTYVVDCPPDRWTDEQRANVATQASANLAQLTSTDLFEGIRVAEPIVLFGKPFEELIRCAEDRDANVIVAGAGGRTGSGPGAAVAEQLVRHSPTAVWLVHRDASVLPAQILCPVDSTPAAGRALQNAVHLARQLDAELTITHVTEDAKPWYTTVVADGAAPDMPFDELIDAHLAPIDHEGVTIVRDRREGRPAPQIVEAAKERCADLIVMGSSGRTGLERRILGSVAAGVLRELPCSVISVKGEPVLRVDTDPRVQDFDAHFTRAIRFSREGFAEEALHELRRCLELSPVSPQVWLAMAEVHERTGKQDLAQSCRARAEAVARTIEEERICAEIRSEHWMWSRTP